MLIYMFMLALYGGAAVLGLIAGSFANAVIYRLAHPKKSERPRSFCPQCGHELSWRDLIPLVSFFVLRGKCRYCGDPISWQYPVVEIATAVLFMLIVYQFPAVQAVVLFGIATAMMIIFVYDFRYYLIPDTALYSAVLLAVLYRYLLFHASSGAMYDILHTAYAAAGTTAIFLAIYAVSRGKWLGFGDVKLVLFMGILLGFPAVLTALFVAFITGGIIGGILLAAGGKAMKSQIPFGPFLIGGTLVSLFWGEEIIMWYLSITGIS